MLEESPGNGLQLFSAFGSSQNPTQADSGSRLKLGLQASGLPFEGLLFRACGICFRIWVHDVDRGVYSKICMIGGSTRNPTAMHGRLHPHCNCNPHYAVASGPSRHCTHGHLGHAQFVLQKRYSRFSMCASHCLVHTC